MLSFVSGSVGSEDKDDGSVDDGGFGGCLRKKDIVIVLYDRTYVGLVVGCWWIMRMGSVER